MSSFVYHAALEKLLDGTIDLDTHDIRILLVGATTTADTETDVTTISGFTTLDEFSDASYARKTLTGEAVNFSAANDRAEFDADDVTWTALTGDTFVGAVIYKHVTNDSDSIPIAFIDTGSVTPAGVDIKFEWNSSGIIQLKNQ